MVKLTGRCFCGNVKVDVVAEPLWVGHCHCPSCRKATSAAFATYAGFAAHAVMFRGKAPKKVVSSPGVIRRFCADCGSPVSFEGERWPGEIHLHVGFMDEPEKLVPTGETYLSTRLPWAHLEEKLDGVDTFPADPHG
ncbi:GFA family protein [Pseudokordiimonas caeni]|uniref:GFA family protein n=1 Tax=Pseudokordiimonas caeni TaxID=2997908 RepID=UPI0028109F02|nr:GFA family protein [Pseudokordiimonas caeni]